MAQSKKKRKDKKPKKAPESGVGPEVTLPKKPNPVQPPGFGGFDRGPGKGPSGPMPGRPMGRRH